ncbi:hypothetical protein KAR48_16540, partial [bacterium]|nr:hypothetical protein [bacterium]
MYSQRTLQQKSLKLGSLGLLLILTLTLMGQVDKTRVASIDEVVKTAKQVNLPAGGGVTQIAIQKDVLKVERDGIVHMTVPADQVMDVTVTGTPEEDDTFRIPVTSTLRGTVKVDGGRGGYDVLKIPEGDAERIIFNFYNANDGNVKFDFDGDHCTDFKIEYIGLEPVTNSGTAADMVFNYSTDAETITISSASSTQTELASTHAETTTFTNPTNSLTINAGDTGNDIIKVSSMSSGFNASLTVNGQGGSDTFTVNANLSIGSNNFTINTESIGSDNSDIEFLCGNFNLSGNLSVSGDVTVDASSLTTSGSMASTGGGNLFLNCNSIAFGGNVQSTGMLSIVPLSGSTTIGIGGGSGTLNLDDTDLGYLADGFADIIIGDGSSGDLNISSATFNDPVSLSSGGSIKNDDSNPNITAPSVGVFGNSTPGQSPGILNISGNFIFAEGASFSVEFGGTSPGSASNNHDQLSVSGSVTISSNIPLNTSSYGGYTPSNGATYTIISNGSGAVSGTFKNLAEGAIVSNDFLGSGIPA